MEAREAHRREVSLPTQLIMVASEMLLRGQGSDSNVFGDPAVAPGSAVREDGAPLCIGAPMTHSSGKQLHPSAFAKNGSPLTPWNSCTPSKISCCARSDAPNTS